MGTNGSFKPTYGQRAKVVARTVVPYTGFAGVEIHNPFDPKVSTLKERFLRNEIARQDRLIKWLHNYINRPMGLGNVYRVTIDIKERLRLYDQGD